MAIARSAFRFVIIAAAVIVGLVVAFFGGIWFLFYGLPALKSLGGPPKDAFPGSVSFIDGEGSLSWWGCIKLPSGDAREVSTQIGRAVFFIPGGKCERDPIIANAGNRLFLTWSEDIPRLTHSSGLQLVTTQACPQSISPESRDEAARLVEEYLADPRSRTHYSAETKAALETLKRLAGPTSPVSRDAIENHGRFHGGPVWGPQRRAGTYLLCEPPPQVTQLG